MTPNTGRSKAAILLVGTAIGALMGFLADPRSGRRRRALARDRSAGTILHGVRRVARATRIGGAYAHGWTRRATHLRERPKDFDDATLAQKVQSELFRPADAPKGAVDVNVANGVVQLRGEVERPELIEELVARAQKIQGVREVESLLHLPGTPSR